MPSSSAVLLTSLIGITLTVYLLIVRRRRYDNREMLRQRFAHLSSSEDLMKMTTEEAHQISRILNEFDCPFTSRTSLSLALFQTYAVPTISSLLVRTGRLALPACVGRRAEDTVCLIAEAEIHGVDSERGSLAIARINFLHRIYGSAISQDDLLFTLCLFVFEPCRYIDWLEWRASTQLEKHARFVLWREIGVRMGIINIPETPQALADWLAEYRLKAVVFSDTNASVGEATINLFLRPYPAILRPMLRRAMIVLIPEDIREAFRWPASSPAYLYSLIPWIFRLRAFFIRHFCLPRQKAFDFGLRDSHLQTTDSTGKRLYQRNTWLHEPWYVEETFSNRLLGLLGLQVPSSNFLTKGYTIESLGPQEFSKLGREAVRAEAKSIRERCTSRIGSKTNVHKDDICPQTQLEGRDSRNPPKVHELVV
ncbi:hypothetical protein DFH28DRAFT_1226336 [Melampsora americana]|nr:hypothetical protein DFH28DRAFT_1226336 [Melampsora americana]